MFIKFAVNINAHITFMDEIIRSTQMHTKPLFIGYRNLERVAISDCAFADDVALIADTEKELENSILIWNEVLALNGMKLNVGKCKIMVVAREIRDVQIKIDGNIIEQVETMQYLGTMFQQNGKQEAEINNRIEKASRTFYALSKSIMNMKEVSVSTKMKVYKSIFRPI